MAVDTKALPGGETGSADPEIEAWLKERGVQFTFTPDFSIYQINMERSLANQARIGAPLIEEVVERYQIAMENGAVFPPVVLYQDGKSFVVVDGNHRVSAADRAGLNAVDAYVLKNPSPTQVSVLTYEANTRHGEPTTSVERERQAVHLIEQGTSKSEAAKLLGVKLARLEYVMSDQEASKRLATLGYDPADFTVTHRRRMHNIHSDVVFAAVADLVKATHMTFEQLDRLVPRINAQRNEAQQLSVVREATRELEGIVRQTAGGTVKAATVRPIVRLTNIINRIRDFPNEQMPQDLDPVAKDQLRTALLDATRRLAGILENLK